MGSAQTESYVFSEVFWECSGVGAFPSEKCSGKGSVCESSFIHITMRILAGFGVSD